MFERFLRDETGLELSEYAVAAALITAAAVLAFKTIGSEVADKINELASKVNG
ncbi:MAG TPA: hypothetical protein VK619_02410 [Pyrinomonadaceae bacterium]|nr:hypothetical protein [Pyrinomonadaceae bacterium]